MTGLLLDLEDAVPCVQGRVARQGSTRSTTSLGADCARQPDQRRGHPGCW